MYKRMIITTFITIILSLNLLGCSAASGAEDLLEIVTNSNLKIHESQITETVTFVLAAIDDTLVEVMLVRTSDNTIRVALNTCENCHASGMGYYVQDGDVVICQHCNMSFDIDYIGLNSGGCQPIPIEHFFEEGYIVIFHEALLDSSHWFVLG